MSFYQNVMVNEESQTEGNENHTNLTKKQQIRLQFRLCNNRNLILKVKNLEQPVPVTSSANESDIEMLNEARTLSIWNV